MNNWSLVAAAAAIEADRAGIGKYRVEDAAVPEDASTCRKMRGGYGGDPGAWPLAYHAFGLAWLAHVADATGDAGSCSGGGQRVPDPGAA